MTQDIRRQTINEAGTILYASNGHAIFELSGKSGEFVERLKNVLHLLAIQSGSSIAEGIPHPVTQSISTASLRLNISTTNPRLNDAVNIRNGLFFSGNCYAYDAGRVSDTLARFADTQNDKAAFDVMRRAKKAVSINGDSSKWQGGHSLNDDIAVAVARHTHVNGTIFETKAHIPVALYSGDPVKGRAVEIMLRACAEHVKGKYSLERVKIGGVEMLCHAIEGEELVSWLKARSKDPLLLLGGAEPYDADIARYSPELPGLNLPSTVESSGSILEDLGIVSLGGNSIEGIPLMGQAPK